jgi:signal peptidase I
MLIMLRRLMIWPALGLVVALLTNGCGTSGFDSVSAARAPMTVGQFHGSTSRYVYRVTSGSMEPTLQLGTEVVVKGEPSTVGAIVVAYPPDGFAPEECGPKPHVVKVGGAACDAPIPEKFGVKTIKRIVAGPGDEIFIREGHVYRETNNSGKFVREGDSYTRVCGSSPGCDFPDPIKIPAGYWFLMGDNRGESDDSRFWGPVPTMWIVGIASLRGAGERSHRSRGR